MNKNICHSKKFTFIIACSLLFSFLGCKKNIHYAAASGNKAEVTKLLDKGVDINKKNESGYTPLFIAAVNRQQKMVELLLSRGADIHARDNAERGVLNGVACHGYTDMAAFLIQHSADVNAVDASGSTPLHEAVQSERPELVQLLLDNGADMTKKDSTCSTPLDWAIQLGNKKIARMLASAALEQSLLMNEYGSTPLHWAVMKNDQRQVELLVSMGADVNAKTHYGRTPLDFTDQYAVSQAIVDLLVSKGAQKSPPPENQPEELPQMTTLEIIKKAIADGSDLNTKDRYQETLLHRAAREGIQEGVILLLDHQADINSIDGRYGWGPLQLAVIHGQKEIVQILISRGAQVNVQDHEGYSPLMMAIITGRTGGKELVQLLIDAGAHVNIADQRGDTPLHACGNDIEMTKLLLKNNAQINAKNNLGETPLHLVARSGHADMVAFLIANGAQVNAKNNDGTTPLVYALCAGQRAKEAADLLKAKGGKTFGHRPGP